MTLHRVPVYGTVDKRIEVEHGATKGATIGKNLYGPDGTLVGLGDIVLSQTVIQQIVNQIPGTPGSGGPSTTTELPEGSNLYYTVDRVHTDVWAMFDHTYHIGGQFSYAGGQIYLEVFQQGATVKLQVAHGIAPGTPIHLNGANWEKATSTDPTKTADAICWYVTDPDVIRPIFSGPAYATLPQWDAVTGDTGGLVPGAYYWLSTVVGKLTRVMPTTGIRQCVGVATTTTELWVHIHEAEPIAGAVTSTDDNLIAIAQAAHGLSVGMAIQLDGATWVGADADFDDKSADAFVASVTDAGNFVARFAGPLTLTTVQWDARTGQTGGLTPGDYYWLSNTPGAITSSNPVLVLRQSLGVAISTTTLLVRIGEVFDGGGVPTPLPPSTVFVSSGSTTYMGGTGATVFVPLPATYAVDDYFLLYYYNMNNAYGASPPSGDWTLLFNDDNTGGAGQIATVYGRRVRHAQEEYPFVSFSAPNNAVIAMQVAAMREVDLGNPVRALGTAYGSTSTVNIGPIPAPANGANDLIVFVGGRADNATGGVAVLTGDGLTWTEIGERQVDDTNDLCYVWDCAPTTGTPALTAKTFALTGGVAERAYGRGIALRARSGTDQYASLNTSLCHFNGTNGSTTTTDVVAGRTWTLNNGAVLDTSQFKFGVSSLRIPGGTAYAAVSPGSLVPHAREWTIDCWVRFNSLTGTPTIYSQYNQSSAVRFIVGIETSKLAIFAGDNLRAVGTTTLTTGVWYHIRIAREGPTICKGYVDGVLDVVHQNFVSPYAGTGIIGAFLFSGVANSAMDGWVDEFRVTNGVARVFSPHTAMLLNFNGADGSTTITDESSFPVPVWVANGNAQLDTAKAKFGVSSLLLDGASDWISSDDAPRHDALERDYTVAGWVWVNVMPTQTAPLFAKVIFNGGAAGNAQYRLYTNSTGVCVWNHYYASGAAISASGAAGLITAGSWIHVAAVRQGATLRTYVNGVQVATGAVNGYTQQAGNLKLIMGYHMDANSDSPGPAGYGINGWMDAWEYVIGECLYPDGTTFAVPTAAPTLRGIGTSYFAVPTTAYPDA